MSNEDEHGQLRSRFHRSVQYRRKRHLRLECLNNTLCGMMPAEMATLTELVK